MLTNLMKNATSYYVGIKGTGYYVPERVVTNKELENYVDTTDEWIQKKTGIKERRVADEDQATSDLAYRAALMAIEDAGITPEDIDLIILNCLCPDHRDPATSCLVQAKLGAFNAAAFDINVGGCPGSVYSINIGATFIKSGACKNVLVIGADVITSIIDWRDRVTCCFFGDGAGAVVLSRTAKPGIMTYALHADGRGYESILVPCGGSRAKADTISLTPGLRDRWSYVNMDGKAVWNFATNAFPNSIREAAQEAEIKISEIDLIIPHQANVNIIKEGLSKLDLPFEKAFVNIQKYGNTVGASVLIALAEAAREGRVSQGNIIALSAFGAGLAWGSVLLRWNDKEDFIV